MEIQDRTLKYAIKAAKFIQKLSKDNTLFVITSQLLRSSTSIGANLREADSASSRKDFINKVFIAKKEAQETEYWLEVIKGAEFFDNENVLKELDLLISESREIILILAAILHKSKSTISN